MKKVKDILINKILKKKRFLIPIILILVIGLIFIFKPSNSAKNTVTEFVKITDLKQTILATGQVVSNTDLSLSFNSNGVVKNIKVKVGDKVKQGQILANLDQASELASLTSARGALAAAQARYKRVLEGATNEEVALSQILLDQTKITQNTLINNAYLRLLNSTPEAVPEDDRSFYQTPIISGNYNLGKEGKIFLETYRSSAGLSYKVTGLTEGVGPVDTINPQRLGNSGLYVKFPTETENIVSEWVIEIPNKKAPDYITNLNNYQAVLTQSKAEIDQREAELALKKSKARQSDIDLAQADIISATGHLENATATFNNTIIFAPTDGTITSIDIKTGELASAQKPVMTLQDVSNMYIESNINEANIDLVKVGMPVDITFDAFGTDKIYLGTITKVDPSSTLVSGVVNYKITASVEKVENLKPGMTANMTIKVGEKNGVLVIPERAIVEGKDGIKNARLITNTKKKKFEEIPVVTGLEGDGGLVEIVSGLKENDEIVVLIKTK